MNVADADGLIALCQRPSGVPVPRLAGELRSMDARDPRSYPTGPTSSPPRTAVFAAVVQDVARALVTTETGADRARLDYSCAAAHHVAGQLGSGIGLTAAGSRMLAGTGISCAVMTGAARGHLFAGLAKAMPRRRPDLSAANR